MSNDLAAKLIVQLIDNFSGPGEKAAKSAKDLAGAMGGINGNKASAELTKYAEALKKAEAESKKFSDFRSAQSGLQKTRAEFRAAQADVQNLALKLKALRETEAKLRETSSRLGPLLGQDYMKDMAKQQAEARKQVAELERQLNKSRRTVKGAASDFIEQKDAVMGAKKAITEMGIGLNDLAKAEKRVKESIDATNNAIKQQKEAAKSASSPTGPVGPSGGGHRGGLRGLMSRSIGGIGFIAGPAILTAAYKGIKSGAEYQHEIALAAQAGVPPEQMAAFAAQADSLQSKYLNVPRSSTIATGKELRSVLAHPGDAVALLGTTMQAKSALDYTDPSGDSSKSLAFAVKAAEIMGKGKDQKEFTAFMDAFVRAKQVMGALVSPEALFDYAKYSKSAGAFLSNRFNSTTGTSLSMEVGGSTAGKYIQQFVKQVTGGFQGNLHSAAKEFVALGLADKSDFDTTKTGDIKGLKPGHNVKGASLAATDPDLWVYNVLLPAMKKKGITDPEEINRLINRLFPNTNAADFVSKLVSQQASFANHAGLYPQAQGLGAANATNTDPWASLNNLTTSLSNFASTVTSPSMVSAASMMNRMAGWAGQAAEWYAGFAKNNPGLADAAGFGAMGAGLAGGGYMAYGLFSLGTAGPALNAAAASLEAAAVSLGGAGIASGGGGAAAVASGGLFARVARIVKSPWFTAAGAALTLANEPVQRKLTDHEIDTFWTMSGKHRNVGPSSSYLDVGGPISSAPGRKSRRIGGDSAFAHMVHDNLDKLTGKADQAKGKLDTLNNVQVSPKIDSSSIDMLLKKIDAVKAALLGLGSLASSTANRLHADTGLGGM